LSFRDTTYNIIILNRSLSFLHAGFELTETVGKTDLEPAAKVIVLSDSCIITLISDRLVMVILVEGQKNSGRFSLIHFLKNKTENGSRQSASGNRGGQELCAGQLFMDHLVVLN